MDTEPLPSIQTLSKEHAEELGALEDAVGNLKAIFSDAVAHMQEKQGMCEEVQRLTACVRVMEADLQRAQAAIVQSDDKIKSVTTELEDARASIARMTALEDAHARALEQLREVQSSLDDATRRIVELGHMEIRMRELEAENADLKTVSRFVTLQNENDKLRAELKSQSAAPVSRRQKSSHQQHPHQ